ncbi:MAG TPA: MFS transporter, partial [Stellaceae bacterium]|nr:MFS transporter [Stellaceae bacterium]
CYVLTYASLMLGFGRAGDVWGHGRVFRFGLAWSVVAYLLCAAAPSYGWLLVCRFLQGVGAALIVSCAPALVTGLFSEDKRSRAVGAFSVIYAIGSAAGPLLGGLLVQRWGWPAVFWFRAPLALLALLFLGGLPPVVPHTSPRQPLDVFGAVLLAIGISAVLLMLNQLQHILLLVSLAMLAVISLAGFILWENRVAQPIINLAVFRTGEFAVINVVSVLIYLTSFSVILLGPYYLVRFTGSSTATAGAVLGMSFVGSIIASPIAGSIIERVPASRVAVLGALLCGAGLALMGSWDPAAAWQPVAIMAALALQGFGVGLFQVAYMDIVMRTLPRHHRGVAGSIAMLSRSLGVVTGATLLTLIFHTVEAFSLARGQTPSGGFLAGFNWTARLAGVVCGLAGLLVLAVRSRRWGRVGGDDPERG